MTPRAVNKKQFLQEAELRDGDIRRASSLKTLEETSDNIAWQETTTHLDTRNSNTNVRSLYHADIIRTVTDREENGFLILFDQLDYQCLL